MAQAGEIESLLGKWIVIQNVKGAQYEGVLTRLNLNKGKFCLTNLNINSRVQGIIASKHDRVRWFDLDKFSIIEHKTFSH